MWTIINRVTRKAKKSNHLPHALQMDNREVAIERSAEVFNNYFLNIIDDLQIQTGTDISPISLLKDAYQKNFHRCI